MSLQLTGFGLMGVGIWILLYKSYYNSLVGSDVFTIITALLIFAGVIILMIAIVGCCGAMKENRFFLISVSPSIIMLCEPMATIYRIIVIFDKREARRARLRYSYTYKDN